MTSTAWIYIVAAAAFAMTAIARADDDEFVRPAASSIEFLASYEQARLQMTAEFERALQAPRLGSLPLMEIERRVEIIRRDEPIPELSLGDASIRYDVILQPGHYQRPPGKVGTRGAYVTEQELAAYITRRVASLLVARELKVLVVSADNYIRDDEATAAYEGLTATAFLSVHADGSEKVCASGPSLGYADGSSMVAMHQLGVALAIALGYSPSDYMRDNFTVNLARYYMFDRVRGAIMRGLVEVGELTCPKDEEGLIASVDTIASNLAVALEFIIARANTASLVP